MKRRRVLRWSLGLFAATWLVFTFNAPACVYLPSVAGRPAVMRRIVGADAEGRVHWLEAERDLGFAWGIRWWFYPIHHAFTAEAGFEYIPPLRFAKGPWVGWRMMRSDGHSRPFDPPLQVGTWPGANLLEQLAMARPHVLADGSWVIVERARVLSLRPNTNAWLSRPLQSVRDLRYLSVAYVSRAPGKMVSLYRVRHDGPWQSWQEPLAFTVTDLASGDESESTTPALPPWKDRPWTCGSYGVHLAAIDGGLLILEACGEKPSGPGIGRVLRVSDDFTNPEKVADLDCRRPDRLAFSASADGSLFSTGEAVHRSTGERLRIVGPFSSSVWIGHTLVGVRAYPFFAERVLDGKKPMKEILAGLRDRGSVKGPGEWRGARDLALYVEMQDVAGAVERGRWWLGGIDEAGKSDQVERVTLQ